MEDTEKNIELIDKFIENEKRSKIWSIVSVGIFCLLGGMVFLLAYQLNKSNEKYKVQNVELEKLKEQLRLSNIDLQEKNESLKSDSLSLSNQVVITGAKSDSIQKFCDTVKALFNTQSQAINTSTTDPSARIDELGKKAFGNERIILSDNFKKNLLNPVKWQKQKNPDYTISIRCMPGFEKIAATVKDKLTDKSYSLTGIETIAGISFNPVVKFFNDDDQDMAKSIAGKMKYADADFFKNSPVSTQKLEVKAPLHHIEIWIGKYVQKDFLKNKKSPLYYNKE